MRFRSDQRLASQELFDKDSDLHLHLHLNLGFENRSDGIDDDDARSVMAWGKEWAHAQQWEQVGKHDVLVLVSDAGSDPDPGNAHGHCHDLNSDLGAVAN
mmetsp:Transcript_27652/g.42348  ORF Transcript_27652/g.42348 Transcript_27652/m.42348 type:complete len:100 (+) Transcript_27652:1866-2165(+)